MPKFLSKRIPYILLTLVHITLHGQQDQNFAEEVAAIKIKYDTLWDASKPVVVFTGSSSIRLWSDLEERFPKHQILNTGFGGSQSYDLLVFLDELVLDYNPHKVFIYEGDNDISDRIRPKYVLRNIQHIVERIKQENSSTEIVLISVKPSIARWKLRGKYRRLNRKLKRFSDSEPNIAFVNVWDVMLDGRKLDESLFIDDGLHMNEMGYDIWYEALKQLLE